MRLTLDKLPPHSQITVVLNLHIINSWDGSRAANDDGPNVWEANVLGGPNLIRTTFANSPARKRHIPIQAFPGEWPLEANPARTGAVANDVLGLPDRPMDAVYRLKFTFAHSGPALVLSFGTRHLQELSDESWGIGAIEVRAGKASPAKSKNR